MLRRKRLSGLARLVLAGLLFAHAALAIGGCWLGERSAAQAVAAAGDADCPDHGAPAGQGENANLCLVHCTSDAQNVDTAGLAFHAFPTTVVLTVTPALAQRGLASRHAVFTGYAFAAPPLTILFQNFRV